MPNHKILLKIKIQFEKLADELSANGNPLAPLFLMKWPWLLEQIGPRMEDKRLVSIEKTAIRGGVLCKLSDVGRPFRWISGSQELRGQFLERILTSDASTFEEYLNAIGPVLFAADFDSSDKSAPEKQEAIGAQDLPGSIADEEDLQRRASRILDQTLSELNQRAWPEASASGRILVFEFVGGIWEFMPPYCWENPPGGAPER